MAYNDFALPFVLAKHLKAKNIKMNKLQLLIDFVKPKISYAIKNAEESMRFNEWENANHWNGMARAYEIVLDEAESLLNAIAGTNGQEDTKNDGNAM